MPDLKISQLVTATVPTGVEQVPIVQGGTTKKTTISSFLCGPVAQAYQVTSQSLNSFVYTLIQFQAEITDPSGCFNNTNATVTLNGLTAPPYSFVPNRAGWYQISAGLTGVTSPSSFIVAIYKNNNLNKYLASTEPSNSAYGAYGSALIYLNGSGDYVQIYGRTGVNQQIDNSIISTYVDIVQVR